MVGCKGPLTNYKRIEYGDDKDDEDRDDCDDDNYDDDDDDDIVDHVII